MARTPTTTAPVVVPETRAGAPPWMKKKSQVRIAWGRFRRDRMALLGGTILFIVVFLAIFAPLLSPHHPYEMDVTKRLRPPGTPGYLLGADEAGRDILSRLLWGGRISLVTAVVPVLAATLVSLVIGLVAGYYGGWIDQVLMRTLDVFFAFPRIILAIALAAALGAGMVSVMLALFAGLIPYIARVAYGAVLTTKNLQFVEAARSCGAKGRQIIFHEILPNIVPPVIVYATTLTGLMVILAAGLSFLGLGVHPPRADWGIMLDGGRRVITIAPHVSTIPGLVILLVSVAFNLLGDGLRDALDPRLRDATE
jgi:ABC-type dipeptide/oligopeptide/nickel transport system permease subunit